MGLGLGEWVGAGGEADGASVAVGRPDAEAEGSALRVAVAVGEDDAVLGVAEGERLAEGVPPSPGESVEIATPLTPGDAVPEAPAPAEATPAGPAGRPSPGAPEDENAAAPRQPTATAPTAPSASPQVRRDLPRLRRRCPRSAERCAAPTGTAVPGSGSRPSSAMPSSAKSSAAMGCCGPVTPAAACSAGRPQPGHDKAPLRWRLQVVQ